MFFSVHDLEVRKIHFDVEFPAGEIDFLDSSIKQIGGLKAQGIAELLSHTLGEIRVRGHLQVSMEAPCDRCLEPAACRVDSDFDLFYRPLETGPTEAEVEIHEGEIEIGFYEGDSLELEEILREFVLLALPMRKVCKPDCKGICPVCGRNRNEAACGCEVKLTDDRWAALKNL
ncbi:MAG TPA: DUF177 domain-containing protein [Bryobacteraceae bacterium]|nr:DUF177 domain-containing protein [Bryobacteraceae bacterium]